MTVIRLTRMGRNKKPFYRIVVTDSRKRRDSGWIESIGYFNPVVEPKVLKIDEERYNYWLSVGAKPSEKVKKFVEATNKGWEYAFKNKEDVTDKRFNNINVFDLLNCNKLVLPLDTVKKLEEVYA